MKIIIPYKLKDYILLMSHIKIIMKEIIDNIGIDFGYEYIFLNIKL